MSDASKPWPEPPAEWQARVDAVWAADPPAAELRERIAALAGELLEGHPVALFELGGSYDSTGDPETAVRHYRAAIAGGLDPDRRRQCVIQLASSLRNLGDAPRAVELLAAELHRADAPYDAQLRAFLALALADEGRVREAVGVAVGAVGSLAERYRRSLTSYGAELAPGFPAPPPVE
ncbi:tetratricopeptide repeat protein [Agromyces archimandritae]|uniref:Tetratricopeptide repeat protein n=1 Tax=Agromyces archimandritae TaxID=2781962 RepID=A0A975FK98_9MICO|nr:tetratricopeptide repeat protein [Agromyces archimandritae]QTX03624.1 tetratricopeptide repeat protein [Agromyces archimandritae]